jgi:hypothetical protein
MPLVFIEEFCKAPVLSRAALVAYGASEAWSFADEWPLLPVWHRIFADTAKVRFPPFVSIDMNGGQCRKLLMPVAL